MREPDPFRTRLREALNAAVQAVVAKGKAVPAAVEELRLDLEDRSRNRNPRNRLKPKR